MNKIWMTAGLAMATVLTGCGGGGGFDPEPGPTERLRMTPSISDVGINRAAATMAAASIRAVRISRPSG